MMSVIPHGAIATRLSEKNSYEANPEESVTCLRTLLKGTIARAEVRQATLCQESRKTVTLLQEAPFNQD